MSFKASFTKGLLVLTVLAAAGAGLTGHPAYAASNKDVKIENPQKVVNVNTATSEELQTIRGIGPAIAGRVLEYRKEHGRFEKIEELAKIHGIGEAKLQRIKAQVSI